MVSIFVQPLIFKQNKTLTDVKLLSEKLEWKKQIGTVYLKRGVSIDDYVKSKYSEKLAVICKTSAKSVELLFSFSISENIIIISILIKCSDMIYLRFNIRWGITNNSIFANIS